MAPSFGRSISFSPLSSPRRSSSSSSSSKKSKGGVRHVRSISLPTSRTHPLLAHLQNSIRAAQPASASAGLAHIEALHAALAELLLLPEARAAVKQVDCLLLDGFLALADAYGSFQDALIDLKRHAADVQAALRRCDAARLASAVRGQRQAEKDIARIASSSSSFSSKIVDASSEDQNQMSVLLAQAVACIASASAAVFSAVEFTSKTAAASSSSKKSTTIISLVKRRASPASSHEDKHLHRLQDLDDFIAHIQDATDKVFRTILNTRVALLNIQTQTC